MTKERVCDDLSLNFFVGVSINPPRVGEDYIVSRRRVGDAILGL